LNRERLEQLRNLSRCHFLPIEDVQEDLKIWHLTLLKRPLFTRPSINYGRFQRPRDSDMQFHMEDEGNYHRAQTAPVPGNELSHGSTSGAFSKGGFPAKGYIADNYTSSGPREFPGAEPGGFGGTSGSYDAGRGYSGKPGPVPTGMTGRDQNDPAVAAATGNSTRELDSLPGTEGAGDEKTGGDDGSAADDIPNLDSPTDGKKPTQGTSKTPKSRNLLDSSSKADAKGKTTSEFSNKASAGDDEQVEHKETDEDLLKSGALFRIKNIIAQAILDEFATGLLPPRQRESSGHLPGLGSDERRPATTSLSGELTSQEGIPSPTSGARRRQSAQHSMMPSVGLTPGIPSRLADDFKKCIEEAFYLIEFPEEAKAQNQFEDFAVVDSKHQQTEDEQDPALQGVLSRSNTVMNLKSDPALLQQHLQMRAEKHGRRLQTHAMTAMHGKECWPRRIKACNQSLRSISALDAFAEVRAREKLASA
jgi:hypothetical protein